MWQEWLVTLPSLKRLKRNVPLFSCSYFSVLNIFKLYSGVKYESISCKFECFTDIHDVPIAVVGQLWRSLHHTISYSKVFLPFRGKCIVCCRCPNKNMYLPKNLFPSDAYFIVIQTKLVFSINKCLHLLLCYKGKWKKWQRARDFGEWLLELP